ncbi:MAG: hypothetical protein ABEH80_00130 [Halobaculum sp.]
MFETHTDALYVWLGVAVVAAACLGVAGGLPTAPAPDAAGAAATVDSVAGRAAPASATHAVAARAVRVRPTALTLRNGVATSRARLVYRPVVPAATDRLRRVTAGVPPETLFPDRAAFTTAVERARQTAEWHRGSEIVVRRLTWEGERVTLVAVR